MCGHVFIFKIFHWISHANRLSLTLSFTTLIIADVLHIWYTRRTTFAMNVLHFLSPNFISTAQTTCEIESRRFLIKKSPFELLSICWTIFLFMFVETGRDRKSGIVASQRANFYCNPIPIRALVEPFSHKQSDRNRESRKILRGGKKHCWGTTPDCDSNRARCAMPTLLHLKSIRDQERSTNL